MSATPEEPVRRLLPWANDLNQPCYLMTTSEGGYVSRLADRVEAAQLGMAGDLLEHAKDLLGDQKVTEDQLRFLIARMRESMTDLRRIAESRGERIPVTYEAEGDN
ncbi:cysteine peptidase family C39 domain-containing protein [Streptomyces acidiscabies]|uniref:Uncharacterized protein n=1 Tax=Streptomyces acidiscabies TaxID=42234 RepID=A0A0L0KKK8_9ACTN|nr:hypothetical protein [Streptomyces acidiscabies]KND38366.1 hypothetical protein IQ63_08395 [Streptomyces acidiscabies]